MPAVVQEDITINKDGGVIKEILNESTDGLEDIPFPGDTVFVHYVGTLENGEQFDSSIDRNEPFSFKLGKGEVIKGWDLALATMKVGEKVKLTIKPEYAYGEAGAGDKIPGNSTLCFQIELLKIKGEDVSELKDEGVIKRTIKAGEGYEEPSDGARVYLTNVKVHGVSHNNQSSQLNVISENVDFVVGDADEHIPKGLEDAVMKMKKGEHARIEILTKRYGLLPDLQKLVIFVVLKEFDKSKPIWQMDETEKIGEAKNQKEKGNHYLKQNKIERALKRYKRGVECVEIEKHNADKVNDDQKALFVQINNNAALCYSKLGQYRKAIESCDKVLQQDGKNEKALFRRGEAKLALNEWDESLQDFTRLLEIYPSNSAAKAKISEVKAQMKKHLASQKDMFAKMMKGLSYPSNKESDHASGDSNCNQAINDNNNFSNESAKCCSNESAKCCSNESAKCCSNESAKCCSKE